MIGEALFRLGFPEPAAAFLLKVWDAIQFLDDVQDGDKPDLRAIYTLIVELPSDPFLAAHREPLAAALATAYHKWQAANEAEQADEADARSYMWRAGFYDLALTVAALSMPPEAVAGAAKAILSLYGETLDDYLKEMTHA